MELIRQIRELFGFYSDTRAVYSQNTMTGMPVSTLL